MNMYMGHKSTWTAWRPVQSVRSTKLHLPCDQNEAERRLPVLEVKLKMNSIRKVCYCKSFCRTEG